MRYAVDTCDEDPAILRGELQAIADAGGRIITVMAPPARPDGADHPDGSAGYTIVSEFSESHPLDRGTEFTPADGPTFTEVLARVYAEITRARPPGR
jgi:hypothetical protein